MKEKMKLSEMVGLLLVFVGIIVASGAEHPAMSITQVVIQGSVGVVMVGIGALLINKRPR